VIDRRLLVLGLVVASAFALVAGVSQTHSADTVRGVARQRALASYAAMQRYFYDPGTHLYDETYPASGPAHAWPFSQALWATVDLAGLPGAGAEFRSDLLDRVDALAAYNHPERGRPAEYAPAPGGFGGVYYDDNLWIALALVEAGGVEHSASPLTTAKELFDLVGDGWDSNGSDPCPGGVFWTRHGPNRDRNTVTTSNAALLSLRLYGSSRSPAYLAWAERAYAWTKRCLGAPGGLVADHIDLAGNVDQRTWSYNQGAMIAAGVELYRETGRRDYLEDAVRSADASLKEIGDPLASGEPPAFLAIYYRDLLELSAVVSGRNDRAALETFANEAWSQARDPRTGLFHFGGRGPTLLDQAAMVQVYAELAGAA
jgi:predicted alpha-1,6-mannanase (GH76 family)